MLRRAVFFVLILVLASPAAFALRERCDESGNCASGNPPPNLGTAPSPPSPGDPPVISLSEQEPYRNADMSETGVVLSTAGFQITVTDLEIPGRGFPFQLTRTYRSLRDANRSVLGYNWHLNYDEYLVPGTCSGGAVVNAIQWRMGNGWAEIWTNCNGTGFKAFSGFFGKLRPLAGGGYQIRDSHGTVKTFGQLGKIKNDPQTTLDDIAIWLLTKIEDRNGNIMTFHHNSDGNIATVTDTLGRVITFDYDQQQPEHLLTVTDFASPHRQIHYNYTGDDLTSVQSPIVAAPPAGSDRIDVAFPGKVTTYHYLGEQAGCDISWLKHNLKSIVNGKGQTYLVNNYYSGVASPSCSGLAGYPADGIASQVYRGGTISYAYANVGAGGNANTAHTQATVTDRNNHVQVHRFNLAGNPLSIEYQTNGIRPGEQNYRVTYTYVIEDDGGEPQLVSLKTEAGGSYYTSAGALGSYTNGMTTQNLYYNDDGHIENPDPFQKGNLLHEIITPDSTRGAAGQSHLYRSYTYEPLFNQPTMVTDWGLVPEPDSARHRTRNYYDYQEGAYSDLIANNPPNNPMRDPFDPAWWSNAEIYDFMSIPDNSNLGDLNGDLANPIQRRGNLIKTSEGSISNADGTTAGDVVTLYRYNSYGLPTWTRDAELNTTEFVYFCAADPDGDTNQAGCGATGGGYLKEKVLDTSTATGRNNGVNSQPANIHLQFAYDPVGNILSSTGGRGVRTDYVVNELNQVVQITRAASASNEPSQAPALSYQEQFKFDANNNLVKARTEQRDDIDQEIPTPPATRRWITKDIVYDLLDRKESETVTTSDLPTSSVVTTSYAYDANGNLRKTIDPLGKAVLRFYDERDLLYREVRLKSPSSNPAVMTYDPNVDSVTEYNYDGSSNIVQVTDPEGHLTRFGYDGYGRRLFTFDSVYQKTTISYDARGNVTSAVFNGAINGVTPTPTGPPLTEYPELSRKLFYYDALNRLRRVDTRFFMYVGSTLTPLATDMHAGLTSVPSGEPDPLTSDADGFTTSLKYYDRLGRVVREVDDKSHATDTWYDGMGRKLKLLKNIAYPVTPVSGDPVANRNAIDLVYDANGNVVQVTETEYGEDRASGITPVPLLTQQYRSTFSYDSMNRQTLATVLGRLNVVPPEQPLDPLITVNVYDSRGNKIQVTDPQGGRTKLFFDGLNRLTRTEAGFLLDAVPGNMMTAANPDGKITTTYTYDPIGRLISLKDDNNRVTNYTYDDANRQFRVTYPDGSYRQATLNRDFLPTLSEQVTNSGQFYRLAVFLQYDSLHRLSHKDVNNYQASFVLGTARQRFEYDGLGRITRAIDDAVVTDNYLDSDVLLAYNSLGNVISETQKYAENSSSQWENIVSSTFDGVGFRTSVTYPNGRTVTFNPDELNRLESIVDAAGYTGTWRYDYIGMGRILNRIQPNGTKVATAFDNARRVTDYANQLSDNSDIARYIYGYDKAGNRLFERRFHEPIAPNWKGEAFGYDAAYRLLTRTEGDLNSSGQLQGSPSPTQTFTLDGQGNWEAHTSGGSSYTQTINALNQYSIFNGSLGQRTLSYDYLGNISNESLPADASRMYTYDFLNRLQMYFGIDNGYNITVYRYDAFGRRISKNLNGWTHTRFVYDGNRLIEERDTTNALVASYLYGLGIDEALSRRRWSGGSYSDIYYHTNALGNVTALTNPSGVVLERYKYDAFGQVTFLTASGSPLSSSSYNNNILYTGRYYDTESNLYYYRARSYHPYFGRFLQRDPLGESQGSNLYNYVSNNPINLRDPSGMMSNDQRKMYGAPTSTGSRNAFCMAGTCGGGQSWSLGTSKFAEGSMNIMVGKEGGVPVYVYYGDDGPSSDFKFYGPEGPPASDSSTEDSGFRTSDVRSYNAESARPKSQFSERVRVQARMPNASDSLSMLLSLNFSSDLPAILFTAPEFKKSEWYRGSPALPQPFSTPLALPTGQVLPFLHYLAGGSAINPVVSVPLSTIDDGRGASGFPGLLASATADPVSAQFKAVVNTGALGLGDSTLLLSGVLDTSCGGDVTFSGWVTGKADPYNFNRDGIYNEIGRSIPGAAFREFTVEFEGTRWVTYP